MSANGSSAPAGALAARADTSKNHDFASIDRREKLMDDSFLDSLSKPTPNPGGGAAAAFGARVGIALLEKIVRLELNRHAGKSSEESYWEGLLAAARKSNEALRSLQVEDGRAYLKLAGARARSSDPQEEATALREAIECPLSILDHGVSALDLCRKSAGRCGKHLLSDLLAASALLSGACSGVSYIARTNLAMMSDEAEKALYAEKLDKKRDHAEQLLKAIKEDVFSRIDLLRDKR